MSSEQQENINSSEETPEETPEESTEPLNEALNRLRMSLLNIKDLVRDILTTFPEYKDKIKVV